MELVQVQDNQLTVNEEVIKQLKEFEIEKAKMDLKEKEIKQAILQAMEEHNIKSFENDDIKITYIASTTRETVDTARLKEEGLYDLYKKVSSVKSGVRLAYK